MVDLVTNINRLLKVTVWEKKKNKRVKWKSSQFKNQ